MTPHEWRLRGVLESAYLAIVFSGLFLLYWRDPFCGEQGSVARLLKIAGLAVALAAWDVVASFFGSLARIAADHRSSSDGIAACLSTLLVLAAVGLLKSWIYQGYGQFRFAHTWADVTCFFEEANGLMFQFILAPALAVLTLARELFLIKLQHRRSQRELE